MATGTLFPAIYQTVMDANGQPESGAKIYTYLAGTSTLATTWTNEALTVPSQNPIIADAAGRWYAYAQPGASYKFVITTSADVHLRTRDNVSAVPTSSSNNDVIGVFGEAFTAGTPVYLSDGSGSKAAGQWFKTDYLNPYSSTLPRVGMTIAAGAAGSSGTIREGGQATGLTGLTLGSMYYVGASGTVTLTAPANNRRVLGVADSTSTLILGEPGQPPIDVGVCEGRLTLTTALPVTVSDVTAATTIYFTPYKGNRVALFDGAYWSMRTFAELSIAVPATTSQMYDVWLYDNAGVLTLELLAWTNDTTRATALVMQDGIYVKTGVTTRRYLGSCRTTAVSGQTEDSFAKRYVWNYTHRVMRGMRAVDTADSWTYTLATFRQANANAANQLDFVIGVAEVEVMAHVMSSAASDQAANTVSFVPGIGVDSTTALTTGFLAGGNRNTVINIRVPMNVQWRGYPAVGRHIVTWLEACTAAGTTTWYGDDGGGNVQSGILGSVQG